MTLIFNEQSLDLTLAQYRHVAKRIQNSTVLKILGLAAAGVGLAALVGTGGMVLCATGIFAWSTSLTISGMTACAAVPFLILVNIPAITVVQGVRSLRANESIKRDMKEKSLAKKISIKPGQTVDTLVFVRGAHYKPSFNLTLHNEDHPKTNIRLSIDLSDTSSS